VNLGWLKREGKRLSQMWRSNRTFVVTMVETLIKMTTCFEGGANALFCCSFVADAAHSTIVICILLLMLRT
jgi:hypothetical protein